MNSEFSADGQLEKIIKSYRSRLRKDRPVPVDILAVVVDYIGRTGCALEDVLRMNTDIYDEIFIHGPPENAKRFLRSVLRSPSDIETLSEACQDIFRRVSGLLEQIVDEEIRLSKPAALPDEFLANPSQYLGHPIRAVLWQASDLHFGRYNQLESNPRELAATLADAARRSPSLFPHAIIVSGDVSSIADDNEFSDFVTFCQALSQDLGDSGQVPPILVVPGNHDVKWLDDGTANQMKAFQEGVAKQGVCITPFGKPSEEAFGGTVSIVRVNPDPGQTPPFAIVGFKDLDLEIVLLVSGYFSGNVPEEVRAIINGDPGKERLEQLLRIDEGAVNKRYLMNLGKMPDRSMAIRLGVMHHNPVPYGTATCANRLASWLLETLFERDVRVLLHGHVHLSEDHSGSSERPVSRNLAYSIPCPTLTSYPLSGGRGMNICVVGPASSDSCISILVWDLSPSGNFKPEVLRLRYQSRLSGQNINVEHNYRFAAKG